MTVLDELDLSLKLSKAEEKERLAAAQERLLAAHRLAVDVALTPALEDLLFELREIGVFGQGTVRHDV